METLYTKSLNIQQSNKSRMYIYAILFLVTGVLRCIGLAHLFNIIPTLYGLFNATIEFVCIYLIVIKYIFNVPFHFFNCIFLFVCNHLFAHCYMASSILIQY